MTLTIKNSKDIASPDNFKLKILVIGLPGVGKTTFAASFPNPGFAACETGMGSGLLSIASKGFEYVEPTSIEDLEAICSGKVFQDKETVVLDSLSDMSSRLVKDYALTFARKQGSTEKRAAGVPELDDYGVMGEVTRRLLRRLLSLDKHIVVTTTLRIDKDENTGMTLLGPALPGQMFLGATAMFDFVFPLIIKSTVDQKTKKRTSRRVLLTEADGAYIAKSRVPNALEKFEVPDFKVLYTKLVEKLNGKSKF